MSPTPLSPQRDKNNAGNNPDVHKDRNLLKQSERYMAEKRIDLRYMIKLHRNVYCDEHWDGIGQVVCPMSISRYQKRYMRSNKPSVTENSSFFTSVRDNRRSRPFHCHRSLDCLRCWRITISLTIVSRSKPSNHR